MTACGSVAETRFELVANLLRLFPDLLFLFIIMATLRNTAIGDIQGGLLLIFVAIGRFVLNRAIHRIVLQGG